MPHTLTPEPMPYTKAKHLLNPLRSIVLSPQKLVSRLNLKPNATVLELGAGPGFFSAAIAQAVPNGKLILVDIQQEMLDMAKKRLDNMGIHNIDYRQGDAVSLPFPDEYCNVASLVAMIGEVPDRMACLTEIHRILKHQGMLSLTEFKLGDPDYLPRQQILTMVKDAGFHLLKEYQGLGHYTINVAKK